MKRHSAAIVVVLLSALALASCGGTSDNGQDVGPGDTSSGSLPLNPGASAPTPTGFHALFAPAGGLLPYPYDAFFAGSTDGTLNVPLSAFSTATFRMPGVPTMQEQGFKDYNIVNWFGGWLPAGAPPAIVARLQTEIAKVLKEPDVQKEFDTLGLRSVGSSSEDFAGFVAKNAATIQEIARRMEGRQK